MGQLNMSPIAGLVLFFYIHFPVELFLELNQRQTNNVSGITYCFA